ncbi:MAG: nucleotidyltransferase domain-containing protein [Candidatus Aerophobetes bacterium]|nr:nucleotidyltransferase domain-containing protein [Candidatus Aerophobetes bacterium]
MDKREVLKELALQCAAVLRNNYKVRRIFLIGSVVKGYVHDRSDIDLVVEGLAPNMYMKALTELYDILLPGIELNLIPFEDAYESLKKKTIQEGEIIYG